MEEPKIPRPRNAFILFRQHHHRLLIDELTEQGLEIPHNSKISKMLGVKWKQLSADEKSHWKKLAEKEKIDHERRYPDYRYKPVRKPRKKPLEQQPVPVAPAVAMLPIQPQPRAPYFLPQAAMPQPAHPYLVQQAYPPNYFARPTGPPVMYPGPMTVPVLPMPAQLQMQLQMNRQGPYYSHPPILHPLQQGDRPLPKYKNNEDPKQSQ